MIFSWLKKKSPKSKAHLHYIPAHITDKGRTVKARWHMDIYDIDTGKLLFICPPYGYKNAKEAHEAISKLKDIEVVLGKHK